MADEKQTDKQSKSEKQEAPKMAGQTSPPNDERPSGVGADTDTGEVRGSQA